MPWSGSSLAGRGAELGLAGHDGDLLLPREVSPGQLLTRLTRNEASAVASFTLHSGVRVFTFRRRPAATRWGRTGTPWRSSIPLVQQEEATAPFVVRQRLGQG